MRCSASSNRISPQRQLSDGSIPAFPMDGGRVKQIVLNLLNSARVTVLDVPQTIPTGHDSMQSFPTLRNCAFTHRVLYGFKRLGRLVFMAPAVAAQKLRANLAGQVVMDAARLGLRLEIRDL